MELVKAMALSSLLLISGCGTTWDIVTVETSASATSPLAREQNKEAIMVLIADPKTDSEARIIAYYAYAALSLGHLASRVYEYDPAYRSARVDQRNGFYLIDIDQQLFQRSENRAEAKKGLEYVAQNLSSMKGTALISAQELQRSLTYVHYYLGLIEKADGHYKSAADQFEYFRQSPFLTNEGQRIAYIAKADIQGEMLRAEAEIARRTRAIEESERAERQRVLDKEESDKRKLADRKAKDAQVALAANPISNDEYVAALRKRYGSRIIYNNPTAFSSVSTFHIDCRAQDGRYLPLENLLLARIGSMDKESVWLESIVDSRGDEVRIYDYLKQKDGSVTEPKMTIEINSWGDLRTHGIRTEAVLNACYGSYGPIWGRNS